jgi:hypothetical protein
LGTVYRDQNKSQLALETFRKMVALGGASRGYQQLVETYRGAKQWTQATTVCGINLDLPAQLFDDDTEIICLFATA